VRTDTRTEANWFYNLSHTVCYNHATDNNVFTTAEQCNVLKNLKRLVINAPYNWEAFTIVTLETGVKRWLAEGGILEILPRGK